MIKQVYVCCQFKLYKINVDLCNVWLHPYLHVAWPDKANFSFKHIAINIPCNKNDTIICKVLRMVSGKVVHFMMINFISARVEITFTCAISNKFTHIKYRKRQVFPIEIRK